MFTFNRSCLYDQNTFYKTFDRDLRQARTRVVIESPFITKRRISVLLPALRRLKEKGVRIIINTKPLDELDCSMVEQVEWAIECLQEFGATVLMTSGHHRKIAVIDDILYEGSLNILSQNDSCEIMRRIHDKSAAGEMLRFTKLDEWCK